MQLETTIIPSARRVIYSAYGDFPIGGLEVGDLAWATDRKCLYRWSGSAWESIGISSRHGDYADIDNAANYPESSLYQADDQAQLYMIVSGAWKLITLLPVLTAIASDDLKNSNNAEKTTTAPSYTKIKEVKVNEAFNGIMRIKFDLKRGVDFLTCHGRIYKNGVAIGTDQSTMSETYVTMSEDLSLNLVVNDLLQIYAYHINEQNVYIRNMRFYYRNKLTQIGGSDLITEIIAEKAAISTTNQDP